MTAPDYLRGKAAVRSVMALIVGRSVAGAEAYAAGRGNWRSTPAVGQILKGNVSAMNTGDNDGLVGIDGSDLLGLIYPLEVVSRLLGTRAVPFDIRLNTVIGGVKANWVGEGAPAPVSRQTLATSSILRRLKLQSITAIDEELARSSSPNAEVEISADMVSSLVAASDSAFVDADNAGVAGERPASPLYGAPTFAVGGSTIADIDAGLGQLQLSLLAYGSTLQFSAYVLHPAVLATMALMRSPSGELAYPMLDVRRGGFLGGIPVIPSASVRRQGSPLESSIALIDAARIRIADDGELRFVTSAVTSLEMLDNPTNNSVIPTATSMTSMMQTSSVACKGTRIINWAAATGAAAVLTGVSL